METYRSIMDVVLSVLGTILSYWWLWILLAILAWVLTWAITMPLTTFALLRRIGGWILGVLVGLVLLFVLLQVINTAVEKAYANSQASQAAQTQTTQTTTTTQQQPATTTTQQSTQTQQSAGTTTMTGQADRVSGADGTGGLVGGCWTLEQVRSLTGVDWTRVGSEPCAYNYNTSDGSYKPFTAPAGEIYNVATQDGKVHVGMGTGNQISAKAATVRPLSGNPGLTSQQAYDLLRAYAPGAGYDPSIIVCDDCTGGSSTSPQGSAPQAAQPTAAPASGSTGCPAVAGYTSSPIDGGCLYKASTPSTFVIPSGWKAYFGMPAKWYTSGSIPNATQVSLYRQ